MNSFWIYFGIYSFGCLFMLVYFLIGRTPALNERSWPWPVVFLWPLLVFWPVHALAGHFIKRSTRKQK
jgi:hypothetical protein